MAQKFNINKASKEEILKLKGVGEAKANSIAEFMNKGGTFNTFEEFQSVAKIQPSYVSEVKATLNFGDTISVAPSIKAPEIIDPQKFVPPITLPPFTLPPLQYYQFEVTLKGLAANASNPFQGYKLSVGYKIGTSNKTKTLPIPATGKVPVKLSTFYKAAIGNTFHLMVAAPDASIIYDSTFQIDDGGEVQINVPTFSNQDLEITLKKAAAVNYEGYSLKLKSKINRGESGIDYTTNSYDIASSNTIDVDFGSFGKVIEFDASVISTFGEVFFTKTYEWKDIPESAGLHKISIDLPVPISKTFDLQLVVDPEELTNPYLDHVAMVSYELRDPSTLNIIRRVETSFPINALGKAKVNLRHYSPLGELLLQVKAPGGEVIGNRTIHLSDIDGNGEVEVKVPPRELAGVEGIETLPDRPKKLVGRVIDANGSRKFEKIQVVIYSSTVENPTENDFEPLLIANTESEGYFTIDMPQGYFTDAYAKVGIPKKGNTEGQVFDVPIRLEKDSVVMVEDGETSLEMRLFFPPKVILVVDSQSEEECDCNSDKNNCNLGFNRSKMVVDEFSYFTVVRTTEPSIQGYTIEEDGDMTIKEVLDVVPIAPDDSETDIPIEFKRKSVNRNVLMKFINDKKGLTFTTLTKAINESNAKKLRAIIKPQRQVKAIGRHLLDIDNQIDWDEDPTIYQATTLSHGHLLHFKQEWVSDGYSLGDLLYSLPLAPGQKKQIVVFDWERRESAGRTESLDYQEGLYSSLSRDRDVSEIVTGALSENVSGGSTAKTSAIGGGLGIGAIGSGIGALLGVAGGTSKSSSTAWQNSSRKTAMNDIQSLRDKTVQSANAVRSQRGTVVQTAAQGERFSVETEVVANYNHCHTLTIQYFEVLRHLKLNHRLSSVQECLFIPLLMSTFDYQKILRWREILERYVRDRKLRKGFDAIERIENDYEGSDLPLGTFAQENIEFLEGSLMIQFDIPSPTDLEILTEKEQITEAFQWISWIVPSIQKFIDRIYEAEANRRNQLFYEFVAPEICAAIVENMRFEAILQGGIDGTESTVALPLDTTLTSRFRNGHSHYVSLRQDNSINGLPRESVKALAIRKAANVTLSNGNSLAAALPVNTRVIIRSANLQYRTKHYSNYLIRKSSVMDDLIGYGGINDDSDYVRISSPLNRLEMRNPRNEDLEVANALQDHLNDNMEFFHKAIWMNMSPQRRFMFLDGIQVNDYSESERYPLGVVRSVASVVENKVIGVVGNSLVMPVAPGFRLDPNTKGKEIDLISLYQPTTPIEPIHISIPTKGVFAEGVLGNCNSCEIIEDERFWRWSQEPLPDNPTAIGTVNTDSRRSEPQSTTPTAFPEPIINIQNAPGAPDPTGFAAVADILKNTNFKDITGLDQNQKNALEALKTSLSTAQAFGSKAADMAALGAQLDAIDKAKKNGLMSSEDAKKQTDQAFKNFNEGKTGSVGSQLDQVKQINEAVKKGEVEESTGNKLKEKVIEGSSPKNKSVLDNKALNDKISKSTSLAYETDNEKLSVETGDGAAIPTTLLKFAVNFRKPKTFTWRNGVTVNYDGHFGFDWLRDEYVNPMENVLSDLSKNPLNTVTPLCSDTAKLKTEYLNGDPSPVKPFGTDYYPAWLSIMPYTTEAEFKHGSSMHKHGVKLSLEIDEIDALSLHDNTIEFQIASPENNVLSISPSKISLQDVLKDGKKKTVTLDASAGITRTFWYLEDYVTVKCSGGTLANHTEIKVVAKGSDKQETVGKLMVYANNRIPKAEIVMVRFSYDGANVSLDSQYHSLLKNNSFNQALVRAEIVDDEKFTLNDLDAADADVVAFKAAYPDGNKHNAGNFADDLLKLYQKFGVNNPAPADKRTILFLTDQNATSGGIAEANVVLNKFVWGNSAVVFGTNLSSDSSFIHEVGHSLSLAHTFSTTATAGLNNKHIFYRGYTDNVMDYVTRFDGTAAKGLIANPLKRKFFFKWQWDIIRTDQSLKDNY